MRIVRFLSSLAWIGLFLVVGVLANLHAAAQTTAPNEWTWMGGKNTAGTYIGGGSFGTYQAANWPGSLVGASGLTDAKGDLWLFGGAGYGIQVNENGTAYGSAQGGFLDNLWEFDPSIGEWALQRFTEACVTYANGTSCGGTVVCDGGLCGQPGGYGGTVPVQDYVPTGRNWSSHWTASNGNLWFFGGNCFWITPDADSPIGEEFWTGACSDLWEYSPSSNDWTLMGGVVPGTKNWSVVYGVLGTPAAANFPGPRSAALNWTDKTGNFWLFGGNGFDANSTFGVLNDLWKFNPSTSEWTWVGGSSTVPFQNGGQAGVYGTLKAPASGNIPGGRYGATSWTDSSGNLWLFGGYGDDAHGVIGYLNDLWEYSTTGNQWAWMGGGSAVSAFGQGQTGEYGTLGVPSSANAPGGRYDATSWTDKSGNLWLFGGYGTDAAGTMGYLNDFWEYRTKTNQWTWVGGNSTANQQGAYGTSGAASLGNIPPSREGATGWVDKNGNFWLLGGQNKSGAFADLWEFQPSSIPPSFPTAATPVLSPSPGSYNSAQSVTIADTTPGVNIFYTTDGMTTPTTASAQYTGTILASSTETIQAVAVAANYLNSAVASATYTINLPAAATPTFSVAGGTYATNQSVAINDATSGATIYYTTDGTTPTTGSAVYGGPIPVNSSETIEAIATASGYSTSAVATATYTIPQSFTLALNPTSMTVAAGASGTSQITVQDEGGFNGNVSFACSGLPAGAACSFTLLTVPTQAGVSYTTLTVTTASTTADVRRGPGALFPGAALAVVVCCFGLRKRRMLMLVLLGVGLGVLGGCGGAGSGGGGGGGGTQPVTSTVTVTATSGMLTQSTTFTLTLN